MAPARRVSYVIPPPVNPVPRLQLPPYGFPRHGSAKPLLIPLDSSEGNGRPKPNVTPRHPTHRLGVSSLALDTSTQLAGRSTPEGILYTGGRDGMVISWDLGIAMKKRPTHPANRPRKGRWEMMTGWGDDVIDEENEEDTDDGLNNIGSDGDVLGEVTDTLRKRKRSTTLHSLPHEHRWEMDTDSFVPHQPSHFRQCAQMHSDWVNEILLCNQHQTVVSASSDGTVKAWNPHSDVSAEPSVIGTHSDYVRCLSYCRDQNWVASGSFDRTIKIWDLSRSQPSAQDPLITLKSPEISGPKASVYSLAVDPYGRVIASASPERVIRTWDPRSGKRTSKLVGHTDNIRAILISDDAKYLLTGSADASVKLWSLESQRCIHTFMQHTDSVWSLFSSHPSLEVFYSGDKSGFVCRVDVEGCSDVSEGECIVLCQDTNEKTMTSTDGINKVMVMDDELLWTASGSSSAKRWNIPPRKALRAPSTYLGSTYRGSKEFDSPVSVSYSGIGHKRHHSASIETVATTRTLTPSPIDHVFSPLSPSSTGLSDDLIDGERLLYGIPLRSLVKLASANESFAPFAFASRGRDPDVATLYSAASVLTIPRVAETRPPIQAVLKQPQPSTFHNSSPIRSVSRSIGGGEETFHPANIARTEYEDREVASDAIPLLAVPDDIIHGTNGLVRSIMLNDRMHALTVDTIGEVAVWDIIRCVCLGRFALGDVAAASNNNCDAKETEDRKDQSPREALETVKERVEGEAVIVPWSSVETKTGLLTVHLNEKCFDAEIYADEAGYGPERFNDEIRLNLGKWLLRNLFLGFVREHQRALSRRNREAAIQHDPRTLHIGPVAAQSGPHGVSAPYMHRRTSSESSRKSYTSPSGTVLASPTMIPAISPNISVTHRTSPLLTPMIKLQPIVMDNSLPTIPQSPNMVLGSGEPTQTLSWRPTGHAPGSSKESSEYFTPSHLARSGSVSATGIADDVGKIPFQDLNPATTTTPTGGLMGRLRNFTKGSSKRQSSEVGSSTIVLSGVNAANVDARPESSTASTDVVKTPLHSLLSNISIPPSTEAPGLALPINTSISISEESSSGWTTLYKGSVETTGVDSPILEETMPMWLLEYLITNKTPIVAVNKVGFVLLPYPPNNLEDKLPDLLNTSHSKLTASRFLRVRKLTNHVQDKLERLAAGVQSSSISEHQQTPRAASLDIHRRSTSPSSTNTNTSITNNTSNNNTNNNGTSTKPRTTTKAEDLYEILCNDTVLPLDMTLAAVRQFVWRQSSELTMHYRKKTALPPPPPLLSGSIPSSAHAQVHAAGPALSGVQVTDQGV